MSTRPEKIKGFSACGKGWRAHLTLEDADALAAAAEASRRHVSLAAVLREWAVRGSMDRQRGAS